MKQEQDEQSKALQTLIEAAKIGNKRGAFELDESAAIFEAVKYFTTPTNNNEDIDGVVNNG